MSLFTPWTGLLGGSILGASASLLLLVNGDILGCSGIMRDAALMPFSWSSTQTSTASIGNNATTKHYWKVVFMASFAVATRLTLMALHNGSNGNDGSLSLTVLTASSNSSAVSSTPLIDLVQYAVSGLLIGYGTTLSNGCTSGHGVCGLARYSVRSLVAVLAFLTTGIVTATTTSASRQSLPLPPIQSELGWMVTLVCVAGAAAVAATTTRSAKQVHGDTDAAAPTQLSGDVVATVVSGATFAVGLALSGMTQTAKVLGFLDLTPLVSSSTSSSPYDPTLLTVLGSAVTVSWLSYQYVAHQKRHTGSSTAATTAKPLCGAAYNIPSSTTIDAPLLIGAVCFGLGWGLTGLCPGPALFAAAAGVVPVVTAWWPTFLIGSYCALQTKEYLQAKQNGTKKAN